MSFIQLDDVTLLVAGETIHGDLKTDLVIVDIGTEMDNVAHQISWWGGVLAAAKAEAEQLDAHYRAWRAKEGLTILEKDPKLAEWKVKLRVDSRPGFMKHKNAKALAIRNVVQLETIINAFETKAGQLRSKGANMRAYMENEGMTTPVTPKTSKTRRGSAAQSDQPATDETPAAEPKPKTTSKKRAARADRVRAKIKKRGQTA